jgi:hypothetical protein
MVLSGISNGDDTLAAVLSLGDQKRQETAA